MWIYKTDSFEHFDRCYECEKSICANVQRLVNVIEDFGALVYDNKKIE